MKIFTITHREFTPPADPLYVPLHVGHIKYTDGSLPAGTRDYGYAGDDTGEHISGKNNLYGELTGLYWVWKNCPELDYAGLVHYRRYFADENGHLLKEQDYRRIFAQYDVIIGRHITYEVSYAEKFSAYHHIEDLEKTGAVIKTLYPDYYDTFQSVIRSNEQYVFNLFAAPKKLWDAYAEWLFSICSELEKVIDVSGYDQYRARIYGFLSEELLYVWIKKNGLSYYEAPVIYTQEKAETIEFKREVRKRIETEGYEEAYQYFLKTFKARPDLTLTDADFNQELRILLALLTHAVRFPGEARPVRFYEEMAERFITADSILNKALMEVCLQNDPAHAGDALPVSGVTEEDRDTLAENMITANMLDTLMETNADFAGRKERIYNVLLGAYTGRESCDALMEKRRCAQPVSVVLLRIETGAESDALLLAGVDSVLAQDGMVECIVADAAGGFAGHTQASVVDISAAVYENIAQVKNAAVKTASYDTVLLLTAGTLLEQGSLRRLLAGGKIFAAECFETLMEKGDSVLQWMAVSRGQLSAAGGWNTALDSAEDYELLLRACDAGCSAGFRVLFSIRQEKPVYRETYRTYAYVIAKYVRRLKASELFDRVFTARYEEAVQYGIQDEFVHNIEEMMSTKSQFDAVDQNTRPILVLTGERLCYGVLDIFAKSFAQALRAAGRCVRLMDVSGGEKTLIQAAQENAYACVVGFQTGIFTAQLPDGRLFGNFFTCPKFNFIFDHPLYISYHLLLPLQDYYVLAQDRDYAAYVRKYMDNVKNAWHFPPAGQQGELASAKERALVTENVKKYELTFIGTYNNYRERLAEIKKMDKKERRLAAALMKELKRHPDLTIEAAFERVLGTEQVSGMSRRTFAVRLHRMMEAGRAMIFYFREKAVRAIIEAGIELHVFSDSWKNSPLSGHPCLVIHRDVTYEESLNVMAQSRLSLNLMSWHKGGMTERVANIMLNGAVCISDQTSYLKEHFADGKEIVLFDLMQLQELPEKVSALLKPENEETVRRIAQAGYENAWKNHRWQNRAEQFIGLLDTMNQSNKKNGE